MADTDIEIYVLYYVFIHVGGKGLNFFIGPYAPFTNKNASEEE